LNRRTPPLGLGDKEFDKLRVQVVYVLSLMPAMSRAVLESALNDPDASVRLMAQNRLAILGHAKAMDLTINTIHTRTADDARDALEALEEAKMDDLMPLRKCLSNCWEPQKTPWGTVRYKARQQEIAMAAIRTLGVHKGTSDKELALALAWLNFKETEPPTPEQAQNDPWHEERVRFLAALALGGIGNFDRSAGPLLQIMKTSPSQRFRLAAAKASLEVLRRSDHWPIGVNFP
jgi:HEAT repeat protein